MALAKDEELLNLLEIPSTSMKDIREQILEDRYPADLITDNKTRICIFENPSSPTSTPLIETGWIEVDIYATKEKNKIDRRVLLIAQRLKDLLDANARQKRGEKPIATGTGLYYYNRLSNLPTNNREWIKYGLIFCYDNIK
jgi:hypothetical protein